MNFCEHWSRVEWLHKTVKNPNILIQGTHSYYSGYYDGNFEHTCVRYLYGDEFSAHPETGWQPMWNIDKLVIGDYVQIQGNCMKISFNIFAEALEGSFGSIQLLHAYS